MSYENPRNKPGTQPEKIQLNGKEFTFVVAQRTGNTAIYKSADSYLRIGDKEKILADLALHKSMEDAEFPVAKLLVEGEENGLAYFIESSLGDKHLGDAFAEDVERKGVISDERFQELLSVTERYARAQLTTSSEVKNYDEFAEGLFIEELCEELPEYAEKLRNCFDKVHERTANLPFVVTHGDFNPSNLYPEGVIDLEDSFHAPYGYDLVSVISHVNYFPDSTDYEYFARYRFTPGQKQEFFERMDAISTEAGLAPLSQFEEDFEFCRAVWLAVRMSHTPKIQKFRYDLLIQKFL